MNKVLQNLAKRTAKTGVSNHITDLFGCVENTIALLRLTEAVPDFLDREKIRDAGWDIVDALQNVTDSLPRNEAEEGKDPLFDMLFSEIDGMLKERIEAWREEITAAYEGREPVFPQEERIPPEEARATSAREASRFDHP